MKVIKAVLLGVVLAAASISLHAQTLAFNLPDTGSSCGMANGTTKCYLYNGILVDGQPASIYYDYEGRYGTGWVTIYAQPFSASYPVTSALLVSGGPFGGTFAGTTMDGRHYVLTIDFVPEFYRGCRYGKGGGCSQYWKAMPGSTIDVVYQ